MAQLLVKDTDAVGLVYLVYLVCLVYLVHRTKGTE
jgi:hypothetical protein